MTTKRKSKSADNKLSTVKTECLNIDNMYEALER